MKVVRLHAVLLYYLYDYRSLTVGILTIDEVTLKLGQKRT